MVNSAVIPFGLRGRPGHLDIVIERNADPSGLGCGLLDLCGDRADLDWEAHAFLCFSPDAVMTKTVCVTAGFGWGFGLAGGVFSVRGPEILAPEDWTGHVPLLAAAYPAWRFAAGFRSQ